MTGLSKQRPSKLSDSAHLLHNLILGFSRNQKKAVLVLSDALFVPLALWLAYLLRIDPPSMQLVAQLSPAFLVTPVVAVAAFWFLGLYNTLIRSMESRTMLIIATGSMITGLSLSILAYFNSQMFVPRSVPAIFAIAIFLLVGASRVILKSYYTYAVGLAFNREPVLIYGAGSLGLQAAYALENSDNYSVVGFIDDEVSLQGSMIRGRNVYAPNRLDYVVKRYQNIRVLIAMGDLTPDHKRKLIQSLDRYPIRIDTIPAYSDVISGRAQLTEIEKVRIEDLLGRDVVPPDPDLFINALQGICVMVTGAGGSIGAEICRQIYRCNPSKLVLYEQSEHNLYQIEKELLALDNKELKDVSLVTQLGDVNNATLLNRLMSEHRPEVLYHAAAYKHVPLVEANVCEGVRNNIFGTETVARAACKHDVKRMILVSTDKAVRPTNVMGATKRVAEQVIQNLALKSGSTILSMVRFGNVLGSSGSVIPLFKEQIAKRQPVTVTHPGMTRYFMTIPEAAQLVIQAGFMAKGGEVFVLNMGEPIKIVDLAKLMIQLSGLTVRDENNQEGDVAIEFTGIRPGEKLFEELLIGESDIETSHPKIFCAMENAPRSQLLKQQLAVLEKHVDAGDRQKCREALATLVEEFKA